MANLDNQPGLGQSRFGATVARGDAAAVDQGLRAHMLRVYNYMTIGLVLTGVVAWIVANTGIRDLFFDFSPTGAGLSLLGWVAFIAPLGLVMWMSFGIQRMSVGTAQLVFWGYAALMGVSLAPILLLYTGASVAKVFFISAATFGGLSLYGYTTSRNLSAMGSFLMMGLIGLIIAMLVNIFLASPAIDFAISIIGVLVFAGLTAWDTQKIKEMYYVGDDGSVAGRKAIMGALSLYLDFINLFLFLLRLFGGQRN
jgi:FtsH-binding integral membrane protein